MTNFKSIARASASFIFHTPERLSIASAKANGRKSRLSERMCWTIEVRLTANIDVFNVERAGLIGGCKALKLVDGNRTLEVDLPRSNRKDQSGATLVTKGSDVERDYNTVCKRERTVAKVLALFFILSDVLVVTTLRTANHGVSGECRRFRR